MTFDRKTLISPNVLLKSEGIPEVYNISEEILEVLNISEYRRRNSQEIISVEVPRFVAFLKRLQNINEKNSELLYTIDLFAFTW